MGFVKHYHTGILEEGPCTLQLLQPELEGILFRKRFQMTPQFIFLKTISAIFNTFLNINLKTQNCSLLGKKM